MSCSAHVCSTGLMLFQWFIFIAAYSVQVKAFSYLLMSFCHFISTFFKLLQRINLKKEELSGSLIFYKIGVLKNFIFTRKYLLWSLEGWRPVTLYKKDTAQVFSGECCGIFKKRFFFEAFLFDCNKVDAQERYRKCKINFPFSCVFR